MIIGYYGHNKQDNDMICLKCANNTGEVGIDIEAPIDNEAYPDGYTCSECWGTVHTNGSVHNRAGNK